MELTQPSQSITQKQKIPFFLGPCVLESLTLALDVAGYLTENLKGLEQDIQLIFKGSFDKANRTSIDSYRGPGLEKGLAIFEEVKKYYSLPVVTDFHTPEQANEIASVVDYLQVPAFLCRQTDMILEGAKACAKFHRKLKVKKGQFLAPEDTKNIVDKALNYLKHEDILLTERGTSFGYQRLIVDMTSFHVMKSFGVKTIHDATHCVQMPSAAGKTSGGKREFIPILARAAFASGADGAFMECHPDPSNAKSDASTSLSLPECIGLVKDLVKLKKSLAYDK